MLLAPTKEPATPSEIAGSVLFVAGTILVSASINIARSKLRRKSMRQFAENSGLSFMEHELPSDFPDYHNPYPVKWTDEWAVGLVEGKRDYGKPRNVVSGKRGDRLLVAFDIPIYATHSRRTRVEYVTIVARRMDRARRSPVMSSSLHYSEDGRWRIFQKKSRWPHLRYSLVMRPAYIATLWEALG